MELELYKIYHSKVSHEDDLLHQRTTWLIQAEGFLIAAFVTGLWALIRRNSSEGTVQFQFHNLPSDFKILLYLISGMGTAIALVSTMSIAGAIRSIVGVERHWSNIVKESVDIQSERNNLKERNRLDEWILRDLPRLTNGTRKHIVQPLSSVAGIISGISTPVICTGFWVVIVCLLTF